MYTSSNGGAVARKKEPRVSLVYRRTAAQQHCAGIEGLAVDPANSWVFTGSRDSTIKRWGVSATAHECQGSYEGHVDWVSDLAVVDDALVSCSADRSVKVWRASEAGPCVQSWQHHSDFVTCLAVARDQRQVASAGLRGEVFLHDLNSGQAVRLQPLLTNAPDPRTSHTASSAGGGINGTANAEPKASIYALAATAAGTLIATGAADSAIRLLDPRTGGKVMKLKGHEDNVRCLAINADGTRLLSGSSDNSVRLWDLGMQKCIQIHRCHTDSVWALLASEDFSVCYSGSRDCTVYRTSLTHRTTELLLREAKPIRRLALDSSSNRLWVATTSASLNSWDLPTEPLDPRPKPSPGSFVEASRSGSGGSIGRTAFVSGSAAVQRLRQSHDARGAMGAVLMEPAMAVPGVPGLVLHKVLNDRRHVLTKDAEGCVALWDVLLGQEVESFGAVDFDAKEKELFKPMAVPAWFACDTKLGTLTVHLEPPSCFGAEAYAVELGFEGVADDVKLNLGATLLRNAMRHWATRYAALHMSGAPLPGLDDAEPAGPQFSEEAPPSVMSASSSGVSWRCPTTAFSGREKEGEDIPQWVADCVLRGLLPFVKDLKSAFVLQPAEGSGLPGLVQSRLNAPRILEVKKVCNYCSSKLSELGVPVLTWAVGWTDGSQVPPDADGKKYLELMCNNMAVPYDMSISAVKKFIWRKTEDVLFHYRILDPARPAPLPQLQPPC